MKGEPRSANSRPSETSAEARKMVFCASGGTFEDGRTTVSDHLEVSIKEETESCDETEGNTDATVRFQSSLCGLVSRKAEVSLNNVGPVSETGCDESAQCLREVLSSSPASVLREAFASYAERITVQETQVVSPNGIITKTTKRLINADNRNFNEHCHSAYVCDFVRVKQERDALDEVELTYSVTRSEPADHLVPWKPEFDGDSRALALANEARYDGFTERDVSLTESKVSPIMHNLHLQEALSKDAKSSAKSAFDAESVHGTFACQNISQNICSNYTDRGAADALRRAAGITRDCHVVLKRLNKRALNQHNVVQCLRCNLSYTALQSLRLHEIVHSEETGFVCIDCDDMIARKYSLKVYEMLRAGGDEPFKCIQCDKRFTFFRCLRTHIGKHEKEVLFTCSRCDKTFNFASWLHVHRRIRAAERHFACSCCSETFLSLGELMFHEHVHAAERSFACSQCDKKFSSLSGLSYHKQVHTGDLFACSLCDKKFVHTKDLRDHERIHTGVKPYACSHCGKMFSRKGELIKHQVVHTEEKPFACSQCGKTFSRHISLKKHNRIHTGEKPYACSHCGQRFSDSCILKRHERIHTGEKPYACSQCDERFICHRILIRHKRTHMGEKQFACTHCDKRFTCNRNLIHHERIHTGEKPFACTQCDKRFYCKAGLKRHLLIHTEEKPYIYLHCV